MGGDAVQEELAEPPADLHFLTNPIVGECFSNDRGIVFVHNVALIVARSEDDRASDRNSCSNEWGSKYVFVVHQDGVDSA
jgi:hypothetical protein